MLPNTYGFTDPAELQALAMERVRISFPAFSRRLADLERKYLAVGLNYHFIPLAMRTKADDSKVQLCTTSLTVRPSIDPADGLPEPCKVLQDLRDRRDAAKAAMKLGNGVEAETLIGMSRLDDFATCMETLDGAVNELMDAWAMSDGVMSGPHNQYEVENIKREWILSIPFIVDAIEKSLANEEQAYRMAVDSWLSGEDGIDGLGSLLADDSELDQVDGANAFVDFGEEWWDALR